jgi:predicted ATPase
MLRKADKPFFVALCGSSNAGKTTLCKELYNYYQEKGYRVYLVEEGVDRVLDTYRSFFPADYQSKVSIPFLRKYGLYMLFETDLLNWKIAEERKALESKADIVIADRTVLDVAVYALLWGTFRENKEELSYLLDEIYHYVNSISCPYDLIVHVPYLTPEERGEESDCCDAAVENQRIQDIVISMLYGTLPFWIPVYEVESKVLSMRVQEVAEAIQDVCAFIDKRDKYPFSCR